MTPLQRDGRVPRQSFRLDRLALGKEPVELDRETLLHGIKAGHCAHNFVGERGELAPGVGFHHEAVISFWIHQRAPVLAASLRVESVAKIYGMPVMLAEPEVPVKASARFLKVSH